jgi:hypothetical protein
MDKVSRYAHRKTFAPIGQCLSAPFARLKPEALTTAKRAHEARDIVLDKTT